MSLSELLQVRRHDVGDTLMAIGVHIANGKTGQIPTYDWYALLVFVRKVHDAR